MTEVYLDRLAFLDRLPLLDEPSHGGHAEAGVLLIPVLEVVVVLGLLVEIDVQLDAVVFARRAGHDVDVAEVRVGVAEAHHGRAAGYRCPCITGMRGQKTH